MLERAGFALDVNESTRKAMKYRRDAAIIIVIHDGKGAGSSVVGRQGRCLPPCRASEGVPFCRGHE